jgi:hypothetical protein
MEKVLISLIFFMSANAFADVSGEYRKESGVIDITQRGSRLKLAINSSVGMDVCDYRG